MSESLTRRDFLKAGAAGLAFGLASSSLRAEEAEAAKPLRCGFIGVGGRGTYLLQTVLGLQGVNVVAICDIEPGNLARACDLVEKTQGKRPDALGEGPYHYRELLRREDVDCLVVGTPCHWHGIMYVDALNADQPFYGEKPMAITVKEINLIHEARKQHPNVVAQFGFQWGAHRGRADAIRQVQEGAIGDLVEGRFFRHNGWGSLGRWLNKRELSGDWMLEQAVHEFNLMWWVTQAHPLAAYTVGRRGLIEPDNPERDVTDFYTTILEYPNGLTIHYTHDWIDPPGFGGMSTRFIGTKGGLDVLGCTLHLHGQQNPVSGEGPGGDTPEHLQNFFDAVRAGDPHKVYCGIDNGTAASYVGLLIRKSLDEKRRVTFEEMLQDNQTLPPLPPA
jgi:predicted dehydrogenase